MLGRSRTAKLLKEVLCYAEGLKSWKGDGLQHLPDLQFTYEEEAQPEDFFV